MTFKALSNIIKKHKEQSPQLASQSQDLLWEQEIAEAQAVINTLKQIMTGHMKNVKQIGNENTQAKNSTKGRRKTIEETVL